MPRKSQSMSSRELLNRIGLNEEMPSDLMAEAALDDLEGDLGAVLHDRFESLAKRHRFRPGDLVGWKPSLRNRKGAELQRTGHRRRGARRAGSRYLRRERQHLLSQTARPDLGVLWDRAPDRGDFVTFYFDSRRFQPWEG